MNSFWIFSRLLAVLALASLLAWGDVAAVPVYRVHALIANKAQYNPDILDPTLVNAWGLANRPAGLGGHIWVANYGNGTSDEIRPIQIDGLWALLPGNGASLGESFRVYFAAGPDGEQDGIFGYVELEAGVVPR
jgi:hypothetical protein